VRKNDHISKRLCFRLSFKMPLSCAYPMCFKILKCKRVYSPGQKVLTFHRFPVHNPARLKQWLLALHLDINTPEHALASKRVCSDHFSDEDFKPSQIGDRRFLKLSAVPKTCLQQAGVCVFFYFVRLKLMFINNIFLLP